ncbi:hypothetical protein LGQ02_11310 [Bacillus shivajii]|uniref:hypothetical protein n=1 Tax=Bacillus shivajii TaxID=1983719 RepID=UPI001CFA3588|nr:hypothetical protein [Bacillus shivajii]UCZ51465.1 hypothetical protein LGQ02_11310 [Bacillus shivajii]
MDEKIRNWRKRLDNALGTPATNKIFEEMIETIEQQQISFDQKISEAKAESLFWKDVCDYMQDCKADKTKAMSAVESIKNREAVQQKIKKLANEACDRNDEALKKLEDEK